MAVFNSLISRVSRILIGKSNASHTITNLPSNLSSGLGALACSSGACKLHTATTNFAWIGNQKGPRRWTAYNNKVFPPQDSTEERRPAYVCHSKANIRYNPKKMWYITCLIRGMTIDEALKQLSFVLKKGGEHVKEVLLEAQEKAVKEHNVEFKSNLWVAESFLGKGHVIKGVRRHARKRVGQVKYRHCHYFVRLEEGTPPKHYYPAPQTGAEMLESWLEKMRQRKIANSL